MPLARLSLPITSVITGGAPDALTPAHAECLCGPGQTRPHIALAELGVCLQCASGLNTSCGFFNSSLTFSRSADDTRDVWHWQMFSCPCAECERASAASGEELGVTAGRRERMLDRHRVRRLDDALCVDETPAQIGMRVPTSVPVLLLRQWIVDDAARRRDLPLFDAHAVSRLRRLVGSGQVGEWELLDFVFCSFDRTAAWVRTASGTKAWRAIVVERQDLLWSRFQLACDADTLAEPSVHVYSVAMQLRLAVAYELMYACQTDLRLDYAGDDDTQRLVLALQLFADTHADLAVFCEIVGTARDAYLDAPTISTFVETEFGAALRNGDSAEGRRRAKNALLPDCALLSPIERYYPHPLRAQYGGELPSVANLLTQVNVWSRVRTETKGRVSGFVRSIIGKATNKKCQTRGAVEMICAEIGRQPALIAFTINVLMVSQLGNYEGALVRPKWRARLAITRSSRFSKNELQTWCARCSAKERVACPHCGGENPSPKSVAHRSHLCDFCSFIDVNRRAIIFSVRSLYAYNVWRSGVVDRMLQQESGWREHKRLLVLAANDMRTLVSRVFDVRAAGGTDLRDRLRRAHGAIEQQLMLMHDSNKPTMRRLFKTLYLFELVHSIAQSSFTELFVSDKWSGCQQPRDFLLAPLAATTDDADIRRETPPRNVYERHFVCEQPLEHLDGRRWCDVYTYEQVVAAAQFCEKRCEDFSPELLAVVGASPAAMKLIGTTFYESIERGMPNNQFVGMCERLAADMPVDFMLLTAFLAEMHSSASVKSTPLSDEVALRQARALRRRLRIEPWGPLPVGADMLWFCREHGTVFCDVSDPSPDKTAPGTVPGYGPVGAMYSHKLGGLVCSAGGRSAGAQKWRMKGMLAEPTAAQSKKDEARVASCRTKRRFLRTCDSRLLESRSLLGWLVRVGGSLYTLCVRCGATCRWNDAYMTSDGMTCGRENDEAVRDDYTGLREFVHHSTQQVRSTRSESSSDKRVPDGFHLVPLVDKLSAPLPTTGDLSDLLHQLPVAVFDGEREKVGCSGGGASSGADAVLLMIDSMGSAARDKLRVARTQKKRLSARERALERPSSHSEEEWALLDDAGRLMRKMPEGEIFWRSCVAVRNSTAPDALVELNKLTRAEAHRCALLRQQMYFERTMKRLETAERIAADAERNSAPFNSGALTVPFVVAMRDLLALSGLVDPRLAIQCAFCASVCERRSQFVRYTVANSGATLVDSQSGTALPTVGLVELWLCARCDELSRSLLGRVTVPTASELYQHLTRVRSEAAKRRMGKRLNYK